MKLSKREKIMILLLIGLVFLYGYVRFIIGPQLSKMRTYKEDLANYQSEISKNDGILNEKKKVNEEYYEIEKKVISTGKDFFSSIQQENFIVIFNVMIDKSHINVPSMSFSETRVEEIGGYQTEIMTATFPFEGNYESIMDFLKEVREYKKEIIVTELQIQSGKNDEVDEDIQYSENDVLSGEMIIDFYSLQYISPGERDLSNYFDAQYEQDNPFSLFTESTYTTTMKNEEIQDVENYIYYEVQLGDSIYKISKKFYGDFSKRDLIIEANQIQNSSLILTGQILLIPKR